MASKASSSSSENVCKIQADNESYDNENSDFEPGASTETMLLTSDSFEDIQEPYEIDYDHNKRRRSGMIMVIESADQVENNEWNQSEENNSKEMVELSEEFVQLSTSDFDEVDGAHVTAPTKTIEFCLDNQEWKQKKKHVFVLSQAGKPIYSRYGSEDKLVALMGVMQALVSCVQDNQDNICSIVAGAHHFVFGVHGPIILVAVCNSSESASQLTLQLNYVYYQIISVLTYTQLHRIFEQRQNFDLRRLLSGSEKFIDNLLNLMETEPGFLLGAVRCLPLIPVVRDAITQSIVQFCGKVKNLVFAILIAANHLVALVRMKKYFLHPTDLYLIMNLVDASESFKTAESWTPICLPKFDSSGYLHAHVSYLTEDCDACLLLLTVDRDNFFTLSDCKRKIVERLQRYDCIRAIREAIDLKGYATSQVGISDLRHFLYKVRSTGQYTGPLIGPPYVSDSMQEQLQGLYLTLHQRMHRVTRPLKIFFCCGQSETMMGWVTQGFELYAIFEPLVTKIGAVNSINKLLRWIKGNEERLFILNSPTF